MAAHRLLVALNVEESTVIGLELSLDQKIEIVCVLTNRNKIWKYSPPELAIDTQGKEYSVIPTPITDSTVLAAGRQKSRLPIPVALLRHGDYAAKWIAYE